MADSISVNVIGNKAIIDNFDALGAHMQARAQEILEQGGDKGLVVAEDLCPVDTGFLRSRLDLVVEPDVVTITNDAPYALPVELGHHTRSGSWVAPQPSMVPGFLSAEAWIQEQMRKLAETGE